MVIPACADKSRLKRTGNTHYIETQNTMVKRDSFIHIANVQMHMAQAGFRRDGNIQTVFRFEVTEKIFEIQCFTAITQAYHLNGE